MNIYGNRRQASVTVPKGRSTIKAIDDINCMQDETLSFLGLSGLNKVQKSKLEAADEINV